MTQRWWRAESGFFVGLWLAITLAGRSQMFRDPGTFWHTQLGRRMLASGRLVEADPFSFTFGGEPWVPHSWLAECLMAAANNVAGLDGLLLLTSTALAGLYAWAAHRLLRAGLHWLPATLCVALAVAASSMHFHVRPHVATIVLLGLTCGLLGDFESRRIGLIRLLWLVPLFVGWSNLHGGMPAGLATLGLAALGWGFFYAVRWSSPVLETRQALLLGVLVLACALTPLVNPYGLRLPRAWVAIAGSDLLPRIIIEHAPPSPRDPDFWMIVLPGLAYGALLATARPWRPRVTWLIPLAWFVLALSRVRNAPLFAVTALVALSDLLPHTRLAAWLARPGRGFFRAPDPASREPRGPVLRPMILPVALVLTAAVAQAAGARVPVLGRGWAYLDPEVWPVDLRAELRRAEAEHPAGTRVFNDFVLGGFLIGYAPGLKVFIDDRCELYGDAWLHQYWLASTHHPARIDAWIEDYRIPYALVRTGSGFDRHLARAPGWVVVQRGRVAVFYRKVASGPEKAGAGGANSRPARHHGGRVSGGAAAVPEGRVKER